MSTINTVMLSVVMLSIANKHIMLGVVILTVVEPVKELSLVNGLFNTYVNRDSECLARQNKVESCEQSITGL
jgi:hypothetical protein